MPPAKRAPRRTGSAAADPTPQVSQAAGATAEGPTPAGRTPAARKVPARRAAKPVAEVAPAAATAARPSSSRPTAAGTAPRKARKAPAGTATAAAGNGRRAGGRTDLTPEVSTAATRAGSSATPDEAGASSPGVETSGPGSGSAAGEQARPFRDEEQAEHVVEAGRTARKHLRRGDLGEWSPAAERPDPIETISATNADRLPSLIPLRWTRMLESPFAYLRGAASVMASDLAGSPTCGLVAQICGDAHVANFGLFASRERQQVIDVNDFDESLPGPWEFDVKRLAASIVVAGRVAGIKDKACRTAVGDAVRTYREVVHTLAEMPVLASWSASLQGELSRHIGLDDLTPVLKAVYGKARRNTSVRAAQRMAAKRPDGGWRFTTKSPELSRLPESEAATIIAGLTDYAASLPYPRRMLLRRFRPVDVALRVGGLGSIGLRTYAVLLHGNGPDDPMVLQVKESRVPTISRWIGTPEPERHQGERTVAAQQLMQTASDPMLGWTRIDGRDYLVRQFRDMKGSVDATLLRKNQIDDYGRLVGALLARAHCRSLDPRLLAGYLGTNDRVDVAMTDFAVAYADQTARDHAALVEAAEKGRVPTI